jgi:hypothetical protein
VALERGPLSLVSTIEELLERKSSGSGLEKREYDRGDPRDTLYPQKSALTSPTSGGRSVGIVRSRTEFSRVIQFKFSGLARNVFTCSLQHEWFILPRRSFLNLRDDGGAALQLPNMGQ